MNTPVRPTRIPRNSYSTALIVLLFAVAAIAVPFSVGSRSRVESTPRVGPTSAPISARSERWFPAPASLAGETVELFAQDCSTPLTDMNLGEIVCAKTNGVDLTVAGNHYMNWVDSSLNQTNGGTITQNPQFFYFTPPTTGGWKGTIGSLVPPDSSIIGVPPIFTVNSGVGIATYLGPGCTTPQTTFTLGDIVCAKVTGADQFNRRVAWVDPAGITRTFTAITLDPQTDSFTLPSTNTSTIDVYVVDNRGEWQANVVSSRGGIVRSRPFQVQGTTPTADLSISKSLVGENPESGQPATFAVAVTNNGPNPAENVEISDAEPDNATFVSVNQTSGPAFSCTGTDPVVCTRGTTGSPLFLDPGETAVFEFVYTASGASGSSITNVATAASDTTELEAVDNTAVYTVVIGGGGGTPAECVLNCPPSLTVATNTIQSGNPGAIVTFSTGTANGNCGTVTSDPASGTFFPVGTTTVEVESSVGGGTCSFAVTVIDSPSPTITCPENQTVAAPSGQGEATVSVGLPDATGDDVVIGSERSDERPVTDPYPIGTTTIQWSATDEFDRQAFCTQTIVVTSEDTPTITCPSNKSFNATSGCEYTATPAQIGTPTTTGAASAPGEPCPVSAPCAVRSDGLALTDPFPAGQTTITWTATNGAGSASCAQIITVVGDDDDPPTLVVPASITTSTDQCSVLLDSENFVATAEDNCSASVTISRTGMPQVACPIPGNPGRMCDSFVFPTGTTVITYTATDSNGNTATGTQTVTVSENPNTNPTITAPQDLPVYTGPDATTCGVFIGDATLGSATANDNCAGVTVTRTGVPAGNIFPLGPTTITYTATDRVGNTAIDTQVVTVIDNTVPVITLNQPVQNPQYVECHTSYPELGATATDNCPTSPFAATPSGTVDVDTPGTYTITYNATDSNGNAAAPVTRTVIVRDTIAPVITLNTFSPTLWPPNHKYTTFQLTQFVTGASDSCDLPLGLNQVVIEKVTSDETENGGGDGNTLNDMIIAANCKSVQLRAERNGGGNGRVYTITFKVTDASGNVGRATAKVRVPHNNGSTAVEDAVQYTVNGSCP